MGQRRVARSEDRVLAEVDVQLLAKGLVHVDPGQNPEPLALQRRLDLLDRLVEVDVQRDLETHLLHRCSPLVNVSLQLVRHNDDERFPASGPGPCGPKACTRSARNRRAAGSSW